MGGREGGREGERGREGEGEKDRELRERERGRIERERAGERERECVCVCEREREREGERERERAGERVRERAGGDHARALARPHIRKLATNSAIEDQRRGAEPMSALTAVCARAAQRARGKDPPASGARAKADPGRARRLPAFRSDEGSSSTRRPSVVRVVPGAPAPPSGPCAPHGAGAVRAGPGVAPASQALAPVRCAPRQYACRRTGRGGQVRHRLRAGGGQGASRHGCSITGILSLILKIPSQD